MNELILPIPGTTVLLFDANSLSATRQCVQPRHEPTASREDPSISGPSTLIRFFSHLIRFFHFFSGRGLGLASGPQHRPGVPTFVFNIGAMGAVLVKEAGCEGLQGSMGSTRPSLLDEGRCHGVLEEVWLWCLSGFGVRKEFDSRKFVFSNYNWTSFLLDGIETSQLFWKSFPTTRRWHDLQPGATNWKRNLDERFSNRCL